MGSKNKDLPGLKNKKARVRSKNIKGPELLQLIT